jgi:hypothetical protein
LVAVLAILGGAVSVATGGDVGVALSAESPQASLSLSLATPASVVGPFVATDAKALVDPATGTVTLAGSDLLFAPVDLAVPPQWQFSVSLVPETDTDVSVSVDPRTGAASISGQFTMQFQSTNGNVNCQVGPFPVYATTDSPGATVYSPVSGQATLIDGNPTIPAVSDCGGAGSAINSGLSLPMPSPQAQASFATTSSSAAVPGDAPVLPALSLQFAISPPLQLPGSASTTPTAPATPATTARPGTPVTDPPASHEPPVQGSSGPAQPPRSARRAHPRVARATALHTRAAAPKAQNMPATLGAAGFGSIPGDPSTPLAEPANLPKENALASGPASAQSGGGSSSAALPVVLVVGTAALAFALWLIGTDLRRGLIPVRQQRASRGTVLRPSQTASRRTSATPRTPR